MFNGLDLAIIGIILVSTLFAFLKGFLRSFLSLANWVLTAILTIKLSPFFKEAVIYFIGKGKFVGPVTAIALFLLIFILLSIISSNIIKATGKFEGSVLDRSMGFLFGLIRGIIISFVIFWVIMAVTTYSGDNSKRKAPPEWVKEAKTYNILYINTTVISSKLPEFVYLVEEKAKAAVKGVKKQETD